MDRIRLATWLSMIATCAAAAACGVHPQCPAGSRALEGGTLPVAEHDLGSALGPRVAAGTTVGAGNDLNPGCGASRADDALFAWTAPASGTYVFDTAGSTYDTVLAVFDACTNVQLACDDDIPGTLQSRVTVELMAGQSVIVDVDGFSTNHGGFVLSITSGGVVDGGADAQVDARVDTGVDARPGMCPERDLGSAVGPAVATGTTVGAGNDASPTCGGSGAEDVTFRWVAPDSGSYTIDTHGSGFDTVLSVRDGSCAGSELACNDDSMGLQSSVTVSVTAGEALIIDVDGFATNAGAFVLNIARASADGGVDSGTDARIDAGTDTGTDAGTDAGIDVGIDVGTDVGTDAGTDAGIDAETDAGCASGQMACAGACVNPLTDPANCGACGTICTGSRVCTSGVCACPSGQVACGGLCVDVRTDNFNCGTCGTICNGGQVCTTGVCACPSGMMACSGRCVDLANDAANCGACGTVCPSPEVCSAHVCACPSGLTLCAGACVDVRSDRANCGTCGHGCPGSQTCLSGSCHP